MFGIPPVTVLHLSTTCDSYSTGILCLCVYVCGGVGGLVALLMFLA